MDPTIAPVGPSGEMGQQKRVEAPHMPHGSEVASSHTDPEASKGVEARESGPAGPSNAGPAPVADPVASQLPTVTPPPASVQPVQPHDDTPMVAADDELLEKEWVEKAKKIVAQTKSDPYAQEQEVSKLQADYIKKRYGKDIKLSSD